MAKKLIITGMGRSGTLFAAKVFRQAGLNMSHQKVFPGGYPMGGFTGWGNFDGASSASAAPYIRHFIDDCIVVHQFRDKEKVVRSLIANGHDKLYGVHQDDPFALYDHWNRQVSKFSDHPNYVRINVEDYTSEFVNNIVSRVGRGRKIRSIEVPTDTGSNPNEVA